MNNAQKKHLRLVDDKPTGDIEFNNLHDFLFDFLVSSNIRRSNVGSELEKGKSEVSATSFESGDDMDDSTKLLLERMDRDSREREERYYKDAQERELRYRKDMQEQDRRLREEAKEREERILKAIERSNVSIDKSIERMENNMKDLKDSVSRTENNINGTAEHVRTMVTQNFWGRIGAIVAALAICATVGATIWAAFKSVGQ